MTISFTNTSGTGFNTYSTGSGAGTWTIATPSNAASGYLLVECLGLNYAGSFNAWTANITNVTGEAEIGSGVRLTGASHYVEIHSYYAALSSSPTNLDAQVNETLGSEVRRSGIGIVLTGHNAATPIRAFSTNSGNGQSITFPDTESVNDGDLVLRFCYIGKDDTSLSFGAFSGIGGTPIWEDAQSGNYVGAAWAGYAIKSGAGAPGTATLPITVSGNRDWVAQTIVIAAAGGGAPSKSLGLLLRGCG